MKSSTTAMAPPASQTGNGSTPPPPPKKRPVPTLPAWWKQASLIAVALIIGLVAGNAASGASGLRSQLDELRGTSASGVSSLSQQLATAQSERSSLKEQNATLESQLSALTDQLREANARRPLQKLVGMTGADVTTLADSYGWQVTVKQQESAKPAGTVLSQTPAKGTIMRLGALITIVVAKPLPPKMPDLLGKLKKDAELVADSHGWKLTVQHEISSKPVGTIISQTPAPGTFMRGSAKVTIVLAKAAPAVPASGPSQKPPAPTCDPNYTGACLDPNASDYDCAGGSGNGPLYVYGTVRVVGDDHYGLDADNDGYGCD